MKLARIIMVALLVALGGVIGWWIATATVSEPVYKGKMLTDWLKECSGQGPISQAPDALRRKKQAEAQEAVRQIGTKAIPALLRLLRATDSPLKRKVMAFMWGHHLVKAPYEPAELYNNLGMFGFGLLRTNAQSAVPALIQLARKNVSASSRRCVLQALAYIGPQAKQAVPYLLEHAADGNPLSARESLFALTYIDPEAAATVESTFIRKVLYCSGTVRYPDGAPAPGVLVEYYPGHHNGAGRFTAARSDAGGRYELVGPEDTAMYNGDIDETDAVMARALKENLAVVEDVHMTTNRVDLVLQPAITLSGSVKDTEGAPIVAAEVDLGILAGSLSHPLEGHPIKVNEFGEFSVPALPRGREYFVSRISAKGYCSGWAQAKASDTRTNRYEFPPFLLMRADRKIAGRVMDEAGKPLAGAEVYFAGKGQPENFMGLGKSVNSTSTDSEGRFHYDGVCDAPLRVNATYYDPLDPTVHLGLRGGSGMPAAPGDTNIVIQLAK